VYFHGRRERRTMRGMMLGHGTELRQEGTRNMAETESGGRCRKNQHSTPTAGTIDGK
jgi:hypothetical protein